MNTTQTNPAPDTNQPAGSDQATGHQHDLYRPLDDRMVAGVAAGLARYLGADVTLVRIVLIALVFIGGAGLPLYLAGWLLMPEEGSEQSIAGDFIRPRSARAN
jgi:phage shock protein PspC (stress-responsive transcriptional regulator)